MSAGLRHRPCKEETECLLIVEGKDDCNSIFHIACQYAIEDEFGIWEAGSYEGALKRFGGSLLATANRPSVIGLVIDCDTLGDPQTSAIARRWAEISHRLAGPGYKVPDEPDRNGTILDGGGGLPRVGIWIMPNNFDDGMLEDFLLSLVPAQSVAYTRRVVQAAKAALVATYNDGHESKAIAHTYLAWQDEPGYPLGLGVKAKLLDANNENAVPFTKWLKELFGTSDRAKAEAPN